MCPVYKTTLPKMGIVKNLLLEHQYGPMMMQGLKMPKKIKMQRIEQKDGTLSWQPEHTKW